MFTSFERLNALCPVKNSKTVWYVAWRTNTLWQLIKRCTPVQFSFTLQHFIEPHSTPFLLSLSTSMFVLADTSFVVLLLVTIEISCLLTCVFHEFYNACIAVHHFPDFSDKNMCIFRATISRVGGVDAWYKKILYSSWFHAHFTENPKVLTVYIIWCSCLYNIPDKLWSYVKFQKPSNNLHCSIGVSYTVLKIWSTFW